MHDPACQRCGESLFEGESFCPACGGAVESAVAVATPPGPTPADATSHRTRAGEIAVPCSACGRELARIERFCPKCGAPRLDLPSEFKRPRRPIGGEAAWKQLAERLREVTRGRYEILHELGRGGMAAVFLAHELALGRKVAIKVMRPSLLLDGALVERFLREARTMASFQHPNIVTVHAVEAAADLHYFVMQYIPGQSLAQVVREFGPLPVAAVQSVLFQAAAGLAHAHRAGVIHRDVKPANIMIDAGGNAIVTDFGIAKVMDLTTSATVGPMGTPLYMSPEQCAGLEALTPASDQYALGTVAFELLTGKPPFERDSAVALALAISKDPPPSVRSLREDCPPEIDAAVRRMLAKRPQDRFPSLPEAIAAVGGEALPDDDPVRGFLAALARRDPRSADSSSLTPRRSRSAPGRVRGDDVSRRAAARRTAASVGILATAVVATVLAVRAAFRPSAATPDRPDTAVAARAALPPDSAAVRPSGSPPPPASEVQAEVARRLAASKLAIRASDLAAAERELGRILALDRDHTEARSLLSEVRRTRQADRMGPAGPATARVDTVRQVDTVLAAPPPGPPPSRDSVRASPPSRAPEIRAMLSRYVEAINARSLGQLRAVYPAIPADREGAWRDVFRPDVKNLAATLEVRRIDERGDLADAIFVVSLSFRPDRGEPLSYTIVCDATIRYEGGGWKIVSMQERGG